MGRTKDVSQDNLCPCLDLNRAPLECKLEALTVSDNMLDHSPIQRITGISSPVLKRSEH
jgi:hypothetical protein